MAQPSQPFFQAGDLVSSSAFRVSRPAFLAATATISFPYSTISASRPASSGILFTGHHDHDIPDARTAAR